MTGRESLIPFRDLKERVTDSWAAPVLSRDEALALIEVVEAAREVVWHKDERGVISVVSGLEQLEAKIWRFA